MKHVPYERHFSDSAGKLHMYCPFRSQTGILVHVVIKGGYCYRSKDCMVIKCKYNALQSDVPALLSLVW